MATVKGKVISAREITTESGKEMFFVKLEGSETEYSGFGKTPYKEGEVAEFEYTMKKSGDRIYYNISQKKESQEQKKDEDDDLKTLIKTLTMPKIHVGMEQEVETEKIHCGTYQKVLTRKIQINATFNPEEITVEEFEKLRQMVRFNLEEEIAQIKAVSSGEGKDTLKEEKRARTQPRASGGKPERVFKNSDTAENGQKSLITKALEES